MSVFDRIGKGWTLGITSLNVIKKNKQLVLFPIISGVFLVLVIGSFMGLAYSQMGFEAIERIEQGSVTDYAIAFVFYLIAYFIIIFFNVGLVHCTKIYLEGGTPKFSDGVKFSKTRITTILGWSALSATVGLIIKGIQENTGTIGNILSNIVGIIWSIATFFVVPVLAYEEVGPIEALKRSGAIMKEKWGESIGASFSFGILTFLGILLIALPVGFLLSYLIHPVLGIGTGILLVFFIQSIVSSAQMVFITTVYHQVADVSPIENNDFNPEILDSLFVEKKKKGIFG
ncbi:DUF6159 family protein [Crocinitomix catalasitica]|uniref:DUF6159 family protein n=1 Tax=Crocinitomix catalasitica TaxID=184607 RepID=UPI000486509E|nr:DUF6159 family protein [Crocinitomix catalasitica]